MTLDLTRLLKYDTTNMSNKRKKKVDFIKIKNFSRKAKISITIKRKRKTYNN